MENEVLSIEKKIKIYSIFEYLFLIIPIIICLIIYSENNNYVSFLFLIPTTITALNLSKKREEGKKKIKKLKNIN